MVWYMCDVQIISVVDLVKLITTAIVCWTDAIDGGLRGALRAVSLTGWQAGRRHATHSAIITDNRTSCALPPLMLRSLLYVRRCHGYRQVLN